MSLTPQEKDALRKAGDLTAKVRQAEADGRVAAALAHRTGQYLMLKGSGAARSDQARLDHLQKVLLRCNRWRYGSRQSRPSYVLHDQVPEDGATGIAIAQAFDTARDGD